MLFLLDTNAVIALLNDGTSKLAQRARQHSPADIGISAIVSHELFYGAFKSKRADQNIALVDSLRFVVVDFDKEDSRHAGAIRAALGALGSTIGPLDVLIAGQARARNLTLVSHNTREFGRVPGLLVEDWEA